MLRNGLLACAVAVAACGTDGVPDPGPDAGLSPACIEAQGYQDLASIEAKIFEKSCVFSGCHDGVSAAGGRLDLHVGKAHASLVDVDSDIESGKDPQRKLVVAGDPARSYLMVMIGQIRPDQADPAAGPIEDGVGTMPQGTGGKLLCEPKRDAIERWIMAGALDN
jgi:hypothetical protein